MLPRAGGNGVVDIGPTSGGENDRHLGQIVLDKGPAQRLDRSCIREGLQLFIQVWRDDCNVATSAAHQADLAGRQFAAADKQHMPVADVEGDG